MRSLRDTRSMPKSCPSSCRVSAYNTRHAKLSSFHVLEGTQVSLLGGRSNKFEREQNREDHITTTYIDYSSIYRDYSLHRIHVAQLTRNLSCRILTCCISHPCFTFRGVALNEASIVICFRDQADPISRRRAQKASVVPISCLLLPEPTSGRRAGFEDLDLHCVSNAGQLSVSQNGTSVG